MVCSFIPPSNQVVAVVIVLVAVSCQGFVSGGFPKAAVMVSKQYNTLVMAVMQVRATLKAKVALNANSR